MNRTLRWLVFGMTLLGAIAFIVGFSLLVGGCASTVIPKPVQAAVASWDGNEQNSGFIAFAPQGGGYITAHDLDGYNALVEDYGKHFAPALRVNDGIAPATNNFYIDAEHLSNFATMKRWRREGVKP